MKSAIKKHIIPIIIFAGVGLFVYLPILGSINSKILGNVTPTNIKDGFQFIWNFWWAKKTCLGMCGDFWYTNYQFFPTGTSLLFHNFSYINLIIMLPIMFLGISPVGAYNLSLIIAIIFSSIGSYFLVYHLTKNKYSSFISGLIYGISPFLIGHILDGQFDLAIIQFLPFWLLFLIKSEESKKIIYPIIAGILLFIIALTSPSFIIIIFPVWTIWIIYKLISNPKKYQNIFKKNLLILVIFLIPFIFFFYKNYKAANSFNVNGSTKWNSEHFSSDLLAFITPPKATFLGEKLFNTKYEDYEGIYSDKSVYLGFSVLLLSGLGIFFRKRKSIFWLCIGILALILSLGPKLHMNGEIVTLWMPSSALEKLPIFNLLRAPSRFSVILFLSLAVLAGYGVTFIIQKFKTSYLKIFITTIIALLVIFEYFPFYKNIRNLNIPKGYEKIKEDKEDFAILEIPLIWMSGLENKGGTRQEALYYQTYHEKEIAGGYITRIEKNTWESHRDIKILDFIMKEQNRMSSPNQETLRVLEKYIVNNPKEILANNKFKYLVIYKTQQIELNNKIKNVLDNNLKLYFEDD